MCTAACQDICDLRPLLQRRVSRGHRSSLGQAQSQPSFRSSRDIPLDHPRNYNSCMLHTLLSCCQGLLIPRTSVPSLALGRFAGRGCPRNPQIESTLIRKATPLGSAVPDSSASHHETMGVGSRIKDAPQASLPPATTLSVALGQQTVPQKMREAYLDALCIRRVRRQEVDRRARSALTI